MSKSQLTRAELMAAMQRILSGDTKRISPERKLSVKAVEEEAGLGDGSAYYYQDIIRDIKKSIPKHRHMSADSEHTDKINSLRLRLKNEQRLKEQYRTELMKVKEYLVHMSSQHNMLSVIIQQYKDKILALEAGLPHLHHPGCW